MPPDQAEDSPPQDVETQRPQSGRYGRRAYDDANERKQAGAGGQSQKSSDAGKGDDHGDHDDGDKKSKDGKDKDDHDGKKKKNVFQNPIVRIALVVVVVLLLIGGFIWWRSARQYEDTDDAFIDTHIVHIAPQIMGQITSVQVNDNELVHEGQPIADINSADADARLSQIQAQVIQADTQYQQAMASTQAVEAQVENAERDLARYRNLQRTTPEAVARQQVDQAAATAKNLAAQRDAAQAQVAGTLAQKKVYETQVAAAEINLGYTHIAAPMDGHVAQRSVAVGDYVVPGQALLDIVPLQVWVTANFKETQLAHMQVGQGVTISVDACDGVKVPGHIDSIQRGAGQAFGILPPENATGNYVKVVQRVPVKIVLDRLPDNCPLGPGMSVQPSVKIR